MSDELNPNHPVTREFHEQWHKLCAILLLRHWHEQHAGGPIPRQNPYVLITSADVQQLINSGHANITMRSKGDVIRLELVTDREAANLARQEGGLPV